MTKKPIVPVPERSPAAVRVPVRIKRVPADARDLTVRVSAADWTRLHQFAMDQGTSVQALVRAGLSRILADYGLPPICG